MMQHNVGALPHEDYKTIGRDPQLHIRYAEAGYRGDFGHDPDAYGRRASEDYMQSLHNDISAAKGRRLAARTPAPHQPELPLDYHRAPQQGPVVGQQFSPKVPAHV